MGKEKVTFDMTEELSKGDTPQMERNKRMRAAHSRPHTNTHSQSDSEGPSADKGRVGKKAGKVGQNMTNRKSSGSTRGKRVSNLFEGGIICKSPFPSLFSALTN